jgi:hypothetical protein
MNSSSTIRNDNHVLKLVNDDNGRKRPDGTSGGKEREEERPGMGNREKL